MHGMMVGSFSHLAEFTDIPFSTKLNPAHKTVMQKKNIFEFSRRNKVRYIQQRFPLYLIVLYMKFIISSIFFWLKNWLNLWAPCIYVHILMFVLSLFLFLNFPIPPKLPPTLGIISFNNFTFMYLFYIIQNIISHHQS